MVGPPPALPDDLADLDVALTEERDRQQHLKERERQVAVAEAREVRRLAADLQVLRQGIDV